ncbi:diguanylate cyclase (GGDEF) domain-containing protein [Thermanaeromonas toyohensis ToBE]|uniref:Diguanylate cyclase (GGDEF) domain-containing protein n=1 Tax=Thermanaeromonas toyohensis ToBE TaxID=698762 RepID=A0A1W1VT87_9FIRM|nr:diguanylate cyclase (GGDEF) domain-containing protein [Thermanaeromonas toyohensis ToBE]
MAAGLADAGIEVAGECYVREYTLETAKQRGADTVVLGPHLEGHCDLVKDVIFSLRRAGMRVVLLSGSRNDRNALKLTARAMAYGVYDVLFDPVSTDKLVQRLKKPGTLGELLGEVADLVKVQDVAAKEIEGLVSPVDERCTTEEVVQGESEIHDTAEKVPLVRLPSVRGRIKRLPLTRKPGSVGSSETSAEEGGNVDGAVSGYVFSGHGGEAAYLDSLTGCYTRRYAEEVLSLDGRYAVAFIDLDGFKAVNDTLGHEAGDRVLSAFGDVLRQSVRSMDVVIRWGGDEFVVVLPGVGPEEADAVIERIRTAWSAAHPKVGVFRVGFSVGVTTGEGHGRLREVIEEADRLMYADKKVRKARRAWEERKRFCFRQPNGRVGVATTAQRTVLANILSRVLLMSRVAVLAGLKFAVVVAVVFFTVYLVDVAVAAVGGYAPVLHEAGTLVRELWVKITRML